MMILIMIHVVFFFHSNSKSSETELTKLKLILLFHALSPPAMVSISVAIIIWKANDKRQQLDSIIWIVAP